MAYERVLFKNIDDPRVKEIDRYIELGGYKAAQKVVKELSPKDVIETTKATGLRGRGGAGFPTGMKWSFVPKDTGKPIYLCCNADESEPGTCKDRVIMERDPHQLIEGIIIAAFAVDCHLAFIYIRGEFSLGYRVLEKALDEARARGFLGKKIFGTNYDLDIILHSGAGVQNDVEVVVRSENLFTQEAAGPRLIERFFQNAITERKLAADINECEVAIDSERRNDDPLD